MHEKHITENQDEKYFAECAQFVICVTTLHLCYIKNALVFSQSDPHNFFMYIIENVKPEHRGKVSKRVGKAPGNYKGISQGFWDRQHCFRYCERCAFVK